MRTNKTSRTKTQTETETQVPTETTTVVTSPILPPATSVDEDEYILKTAGQRRINLIWEYTQAGIAASVVVANILYAFLLVFVPAVTNNATSAAGLLANAFFLVIGFYFGRTNHSRVGDPDFSSVRKKDN